MATSGTYAFIMNRDSLIAAAFRILEVFGTGDTIPPADITSAAEALNIMVKSKPYMGLPLWCVQEYAIPMVAAQAVYSLGPAAVTPMPRPMRILQAFLRFSTGNDVELTINSRSDYNTLGMKASQGTPNQLYYDPQLTNGIVTLYNVPQDSTGVLHVVAQRPIQDFNLSTDNPDFPPESYHMLKWNLADEIMLDYGVKPHIMQIVSGKAMFLRTSFIDAEQEQCSLYFYPSGRRS